VVDVRVTFFGFANSDMRRLRRLCDMLGGDGRYRSRRQEDTVVEVDEAVR
jgi:hypothetical protein